MSNNEHRICASCKKRGETGQENGQISTNVGACARGLLSNICEHISALGEHVGLDN